MRILGYAGAPSRGRSRTLSLKDGRAEHRSLCRQEETRYSIQLFYIIYRGGYFDIQTSSNPIHMVQQGFDSTMERPEKTRSTISRVPHYKPWSSTFSRSGDQADRIATTDLVHLGSVKSKNLGRRARRHSPGLRPTLLGITIVFESNSIVAIRRLSA